MSNIESNNLRNKPKTNDDYKDLRQWRQEEINKKIAIPQNIKKATKNKDKAMTIFDIYKLIKYNLTQIFTTTTPLCPIPLWKVISNHHEDIYIL